MTLSRKHYVEIAGILHEAKTKRETVQRMSNYFSRDNSKFDEQRFKRAVRGK